MKRGVVFAVALLTIVSAVASAQDWRLVPAFGTVELRAGFVPDPNRTELVAGGNINLNDLGYWGYVADAPEVDLIYEASSTWPLVIRAESDSDLVLLVNSPDGEWHFNDDYPGYGLNPAIVFDSPQSGMYNIWVGTFSSSTAPAVLFISEISSW
ncbi:MAG: peptidase S1 [Spirochaetaceae bacterium]|nr:MAG: peptidase S1 [Spirochaetaceae bacterium]